MTVLERANANVSKSFREGTAVVHALAHVILSVEPAAMVAAMGASGAGKSTLLTIVGCLEEPDEGEVLVPTPQWIDLTSARLAEPAEEITNR